MGNGMDGKMMDQTFSFQRKKNTSLYTPCPSLARRQWRRQARPFRERRAAKPRPFYRSLVSSLPPVREPRVGVVLLLRHLPRGGF